MVLALSFAVPAGALHSLSTVQGFVTDDSGAPRLRPITRQCWS